MNQHDRTASVLRWMGLAAGVSCLVLATGFLFRVPWAVRLWPFAAKETRLGFIFLASVLAGTGAATLWIGLSGEVRAAQSGGADLAVILWGMTLFLVRRWVDTGQAGLFWAAAAGAAGGGVGAVVFALGQHGEWRDLRPTPRFLRSSFAVITVVALVEGIALLARAPRVFPWPLAPESSVMYGWVFVGAIPLFVSGFIRPMWANAIVPLLALLVYDLVLIGPFLMHFATVRPAHRASLIIYDAVLLWTGALAVYYLFVDKSTRFGSRSAARAQ